MNKSNIKQLGILSALIISSFVFAEMTCKVLRLEECEKSGKPCYVKYADGTLIQGTIAQPDMFYKCRDGSPGFTDCVKNARTNECKYKCVYIVIDDDGFTNKIEEGLKGLGYEDIIATNATKCEYPN